MPGSVQGVRDMEVEKPGFLPGGCQGAAGETDGAPEPQQGNLPSVEVELRRAW